MYACIAESMKLKTMYTDICDTADTIVLIELDNQLEGVDNKPLEQQVIRFLELAISHN